MKKPIVDHLWTKICELEPQGRSAAQTKLDQVVELSRKIQQTEGSDVANNMLEHGLIEAALLRCVEIQDGKLASIGYDELQIFYRYATAAMRHAQVKIDNELSHLDL